MEWYCKSREMMDRYESFVKLMETKLSTLSNFDTGLGTLFHRKMSVLHKYQTESHIEYATTPEQISGKRCGWNRCKIERKYCNHHIEWKICKGCKFVYYCCRNHQKKHWNSGHASQCKKLSFLRK